MIVQILPMLLWVHRDMTAISIIREPVKPAALSGSDFKIRRFGVNVIQQIAVMDLCRLSLTGCCRR